MKNLFKGAGSMFAFSNVKNEKNNTRSKQDSVTTRSRFVNLEQEHINAHGGLTLSGRPLEFYD